VPGVAPANKQEALFEVARTVKRCSVLESIDVATIVRGLEEREKLGSTGFGNGIAIPHCRLPEVPDFVVGLITVPSGVDFDAADGRDVRIIAFIVAPSAETTEHLHILSALSLALDSPGASERILAAGTPDALFQSLVEEAKEDTDLSGHADMRVFYIVVQDEKLFRGILGALESFDSAFLTVIDGKNAGEYLMKVPLFAGLFADDGVIFNRVILAVVAREMTNEAVRRIESVTGRLDRCKNVLLAVQDVFYTAGALEI